MEENGHTHKADFSRKSSGEKKSGELKCRIRININRVSMWILD